MKEISISTKDLLEELSKRLVGVDAAAVILGTHPSYVRRLIGLNKLPVYRLGKRVLLSRKDLETEHKRREERRARAQRRKEAAADARRQAASKKGGVYSGWTVTELQRELRYRSLPVKGRKAELVARLREKDKEAGPT